MENFKKSQSLKTSFKATNLQLGEYKEGFLLGGKHAAHIKETQNNAATVLIL